jgi:predicted dienelactone hydrolase
VDEMRTFEILILFFSLVFASWPLVMSTRYPVTRATFAMPLALVLVGHFAIEGWRWQMVFLYVIAVWIIVRSIRFVSTSYDPTREATSKLLSFSVFLAFLVGISGPTLLPVVDLPAPIGGLDVGSVSLHLVDDERTEVYGPTPGGDREVTIQVWYPTDDIAGLEPMLWVENIEDFTSAISSYFSVPSFSLDHLIYSDTNSYLGAELSEIRREYPVIVYSHGWGGFRTIALTQAERLASEGFVVVAIDHTYLALSSTLADGTQAPIDPEALPLYGTVDQEVYEERAITMVDTFAADIVFVLDELAAVDAGDHPELAFLADRLDVKEVGIYGHSTGGGAAVEVCSYDVRCVAYLGLDPWVEPVDDRYISAGLPVPSMVLRSEAWTKLTNEIRLQELWEATVDKSPLYCVVGSTHRDFMLLSHISPLADYLKRPSPLPAERMDHIIEDHLASFFNQQLLGLPTVDLEFEELSTCIENAPSQ